MQAVSRMGPQAREGMLRLAAIHKYQQHSSTHAQGQLNDAAQEQTQRQHAAGDSTDQWPPHHP